MDTRHIFLAQTSQITTSRRQPWSCLSVRSPNSDFSRGCFFVLQSAGGRMFVKHLADDFFNWFLFHAEVVHFAIREDHPTSLGYFTARYLQLNRSFSPFDDFP